MPELIEALRGEATPDGWDPSSGGAYVRELWVDCAAAALQINAALAMVPRVDDLVRAEKRIADLEAERAHLRHIMLGLTIIEKMEARQDADAEEARIRADERARTERDIAAFAEQEIHRYGTLASAAGMSGRDMMQWGHSGSVVSSTVFRDRIARGDYPKLPRGG